MNSRYLTESARISDAYSQMYRSASVNESSVKKDVAENKEQQSKQLNESTEGQGFNVALKSGDLPIDGKGSPKTGSKLGVRKVMPFENRDKKPCYSKNAPIKKTFGNGMVCGNCKTPALEKSTEIGSSKTGSKLGVRKVLPFEKRDEKPTTIGKISNVKNVSCVKGVKESEDEDFEMEVIDTNVNNGAEVSDTDGDAECCEKCVEILELVKDTMEQIYDNLSDDDKALVDEVKEEIEKHLNNDEDSEDEDGAEDDEGSDEDEDSKETDESAVNEAKAKVVKEVGKAAKAAKAANAAKNSGKVATAVKTAEQATASTLKKGKLQTVIDWVWKGSKPSNAERAAINKYADSLKAAKGNPEALSKIHDEIAKSGIPEKAKEALETYSLASTKEGHIDFSKLQEELSDLNKNHGGIKGLFKKYPGKATIGTAVGATAAGIGIKSAMSSNGAKAVATPPDEPSSTNKDNDNINPATTTPGEAQKFLQTGNEQTEEIERAAKQKEEDEKKYAEWKKNFERYDAEKKSAKTSVSSTADGEEEGGLRGGLKKAGSGIGSLIGNVVGAPLGIVGDIAGSVGSGIGSLGKGVVTGLNS